MEYFLLHELQVVMCVAQNHTTNNSALKRAIFVRGTGQKKSECMMSTVTFQWFEGADAYSFSKEQFSQCQDSARK